MTENSREMTEFEDLSVVESTELDDDGMSPSSNDVVTEEDEYDADPLAAWLLRVVLLLIVALLGSTLVLGFYVMNLRDAPRTSVEREIARAEIAIDEDPSKYENWIEYAYALSRAGRDEEARRVLGEGRDLVSASAALDLAEADILRNAGRYEDAVDAYDVASKTAIEEYEALMETYKERNVSMDIPNTALLAAHVGRSYALIELERTDEAVSELEYAVEIDPYASDIWALLGDLYAEQGEEDLARSAYEEALKYIPDMQQAIQGLERLDEER